MAEHIMGYRVEVLDPKYEGRTAYAITKAWDTLTCPMDMHPDQFLHHGSLSNWKMDPDGAGLFYFTALGAKRFLKPTIDELNDKSIEFRIVNRIINMDDVVILDAEQVAALPERI